MNSRFEASIPRRTSLPVGELGAETVWSRGTGLVTDMLSAVEDEENCDVKLAGGDDGCSVFFVDVSDDVDGGFSMITLPL